LSSKHFPPAAQSNSEGWEEVQISVPKPTWVGLKFKFPYVGST
jgi:hypothetical protein